VKHRIKLSFGSPKIKEIADKVLDREDSMPIADLQNIIDEEFMPEAERDIKETINDWWKIWK